MNRQRDWYTPFSWAMLALSFAISIGLGLATGNFSPMFVFFGALPLVLVHGARRYGWRGMTAFVLITMVLSTFWESLSVHTGFPFGNYHYIPQPQILGVTAFIPVAYVSLGYICWRAAAALLGGADERMRDWGTVFMQSAVAAVAMTVYDLATDAAASTVGGAWIWEQGGEAFGVPVSNFIGWWFCTFTFYLAFSLYLRATDAPVQAEAHERISLFQFVLLYLNLGLGVVLQYVLQPGGSATVTDQAGTVWNVADLQGSALLWVVFGMLVLAGLAGTRLFGIGWDTSVPPTEQPQAR